LKIWTELKTCLNIKELILIFNNMASYIPTVEIANNAKAALKVRDEKPDSQKGMTSVGIARARDLANRRPLSEETVRRMKAYFDRHEVDKQGSTWNEKGKGWQAWNGWGGDAGRAWANRIVAMLNKEEDRHMGVKHYDDNSDDDDYKSYMYRKYLKL
jgi:hypothetical protein